MIRELILQSVDRVGSVRDTGFWGKTVGWERIMRRRGEGEKMEVGKVEGHLELTVPANKDTKKRRRVELSITERHEINVVQQEGTTEGEKGHRHKKMKKGKKSKRVSEPA